MKRPLLQALRLLGVVLFVWILLRIDRAALLGYLRQSNKWMIVGSFALLFCMYAAKAARWHMLVRSAGARPTFLESWHLFQIGIFFGSVTPANMGELGRAVYLRKAGLKRATSLALPLLDRLADVTVIGIISIVAGNILFPWFSVGVIAILCFAGLAILAIICRVARATPLGKLWNYLELSLNSRTLLLMLFWTVLSWTLYFCWTILLARSLGITVAPFVLAAILTVTGIVALFPVAPSGLGTREATLIALLAPYGVSSPQAVALAVMMFVLIMLSGSLGLFYWVQGKGHTAIRKAH